jgi:hypothetical protein
MRPLFGLFHLRYPTANGDFEQFWFLIIDNPEIILMSASKMMTLLVWLIQTGKGLVKLSLPLGADILGTGLKIFLSRNNLFFKLLNPENLHIFQICMQLFKQSFVECVPNSNLWYLRGSKDLDLRLIKVVWWELGIGILISRMKSCVRDVNVTLLTVLT